MRYFSPSAVTERPRGGPESGPRVRRPFVVLAFAAGIRRADGGMPLSGTVITIRPVTRGSGGRRASTHFANLPLQIRL